MDWNLNISSVKGFLIFVIFDQVLNSEKTTHKMLLYSYNYISYHIYRLSLLILPRSSNASTYLWISTSLWNNILWYWHYDFMHFAILCCQYYIISCDISIIRFDWLLFLNIYCILFYSHFYFRSSDSISAIHLYFKIIL